LDQPTNMNWQNFSATIWVFIGLLAIWSLYWKGRALWRAAKLGHLKWFIVLLILNTIGILEILYIYIFSKKIKNVEEEIETKEG